jgi:hypothetical protein
MAGTIELTRRCNNHCRHCYNNLPASDPHALADELRADELIRILSFAGCVRPTANSNAGTPSSLPISSAAWRTCALMLLAFQWLRTGIANTAPAVDRSSNVAAGNHFSSSSSLLCRYYER